VGFELQPTEEQQALKDTLHGLAADVLRPQARDCERAKRTSDELGRQIHEIGVTAPVDEAYGGGGTFDAVTYCIAAEELAWGDPAVAVQALGSGLAALAIGIAGSDEQKQRYLPAFVAAQAPATFVAVGEKLAAGELDSLETVVDGDKVTGTKYGVLNATEADFGIVVGRAGHDVAAAIVEADAFEVVKPEDKLGLAAAPSYVVRFDGTGSELAIGEGLSKAVLWTKLATGAIAVGLARAASEYASEYAKERVAFGKPIGAFQGISFKVADMAIAVDAARLALWRAAWMLDRGEVAAAEVAAAVGQCLEAAVACGDDSVQILGGHGYITDHPVEMWFRDAVTLSVLDAPDTVGDALVGRSVLSGAVN
jgi:alkylation response protein AidB-like acyl-CoA dehydrogenase